MWLLWFHRAWVGLAEARKGLGHAQAYPGRSRVLLELEARGWETAVRRPMISEWRLGPHVTRRCLGASEGGPLLQASVAKSRPWASRPTLQKALSSTALCRSLNQLPPTSLSLITLLAWRDASDRITKAKETQQRGKEAGLLEEATSPPALTPGPWWTGPVRE